MNTIANPLAMLSETKFFDAYSRMDHTLGRYETWRARPARVAPASCPGRDVGEVMMAPP